ncbi:hypothetical protein MHK_006080 [Candidatus Magnetomorum sp. HK-1]|nr:hypothetical protein MHK_006080 [Candidatus Magnetomorum sp. HK-1]
MHNAPNNFVLNSLRTLTMLEKAIDRLIRQNFFNENQVPVIVQTLKSTIVETRIRTLSYKSFGNVPSFIALVISSIKDLTKLVGDLIQSCPCGSGKKQQSNKRKEADCKKLIDTIDKMLTKLKSYFSPENTGILMAEKISDSFFSEFKKWSEEHIQELSVQGISGRGKQTCIFPFRDVDAYCSNIRDNEWFKRTVLKNLGQFTPEAGHKRDCEAMKRSYILKGFRAKNRKVIFPGNKKEAPVRRVQCKGCGKIFSVLPSFISREKHYAADLIGKVLEGILLRGVCLQYAQEIMDLTGFPVKSKQTILNWMEWIGTFHPADLLERAEATASGYLQEDEGFQKEPNLRTYIVAMVDPNSQVVWHIDYTDHVGEESLYKSFEEFLEKISFKIKGVTKDKWQASTNALKRLFDNLWIGYCHRHCLNNFKKALTAYQKETGISSKKSKELYDKFSTVLEESTHEANMEVKINMLTKDEAFNHPLLKCRLDELKENAKKYTAHKNREGIKKTTSIVDNFLKIAKRKLREAMSFRDAKWAKILFRGMANVRNFVEFKAGAKNAHKSPFMLAGGEDFSLPWMQVINVHNGFLFETIKS